MSATAKYLLYFLIFILLTLLFFLLLRKIFEVQKKNQIDCNSKFLFIGDSITAYDSSYADLLTSVCPSFNYKKTAQVGKKTDWMLMQLQNELNTNSYDVVVILGGTNDIFAGTPIQQTTSNLSAMYKLAKDKGALVVGITPPNIDYYTKTSYTEKAKFNQLYDFMRRNKDTSYFIDFATITNSPTLFLSDGLHPSYQAHIYLKNAFATQVLRSN